MASRRAWSVRVDVRDRLALERPASLARRLRVAVAPDMKELEFDVPGKASACTALLCSVWSTLLACNENRTCLVPFDVELLFFTRCSRG